MPRYTRRPRKRTDSADPFPRNVPVFAKCMICGRKSDRPRFHKLLGEEEHKKWGDDLTTATICDECDARFGAPLNPPEGTPDGQ